MNEVRASAWRPRSLERGVEIGRKPHHVQEHGVSGIGGRGVRVEDLMNWDRRLDHKRRVPRRIRRRDWGFRC